MFLPVGNTPGFLIGSPPGPGSMYCPSKASTSAPSSLSATTCLKQNSKYSKSGSSILSSEAFTKPCDARALRYGAWPNIPPNAFSITFCTSLTLPWESVDSWTKRADGGARALRDLLEEFHVLEHALVRVAVDLFQFSPFGVREDARQA